MTVKTGAVGVTIPPQAESNNEEKTIKIYFGVFFDGTMNHRGQAMVGEKYRKKIASGLSDEKAKEEIEKEGLEEGQLAYTGSDPQENDQSNVALLFSYFNKKSETYVCNLYIEGIATEENGETDIVLGRAFGKGSTGIEAKVEKAILKIPEKIERLNVRPNKFIELHFELFGFSRGSAAARNFVSVVTGVKGMSFAASIGVYNIIVSYVGLFDTVSAHGLNTFSGSDVKTLSLDAIKKADYVFHICAADEFRDKFPLTNISSAKEKGKEIFIPGAHSDIGGGYPAGEYSVTLDLATFPIKTENSVDTIVSYDSLERLGWIRDMPEKNYNIFKMYKNSIYHHIQFKNNILKGYSFIALELMAEDANFQRENMFKPIEQEQKTPGYLAEIKNKAKNEDCSSLEKCQKLFIEYYYKFNLRRDWLHFSAKDNKIGMSPRRVNGILSRNIING
jgi:hypothetical protein